MKFIAALDQSGGSTPSVLDRYGVKYDIYDTHSMMNKIHAMRMRMIDSPAFNDSNICGVILFKDSVTRGVVNILDEMGIDSFLKIDSGVNPDGTMKQFPVKQILEWATDGIGPKIYGTKMRSIVKSVDMVDAVLKQQFSIARTISYYGLVPIIEPEVEINNENKEVIEQELYNQLDFMLSQGQDWPCILKLTPPEVPNLYHNLTVKHNVEKVVFLSGGYPTAEACRRLSMAEGVSASFSRALSEGLNVDQSDNIFNAKLALNISDIAKASD
jgi:fructose-bisphosphate aldolase, class I